MTKRGLGRGLDALLATDEPTTGGSTDRVPTHAIVPNPYQPRSHIEPHELRELSESITAHGLIQPLIVTRAGSGYQLIAGERRWRAAQLAGLAEVPVVIRDAEPRDMLAVALIENIQRSDLDPLEAAEGYRRLANEFGLTQGEVARIVGKSRAAVANAVRLLGLDDEIQSLLRRGDLSEGHGRALLSVPHEETRLNLARRATQEGWSVRRVEEEARAAAMVPDAKTGARKEPTGSRPGASAADPHDAAAVRSLEEALGTRVELRRSGQGGTVVIHFYSDEELVAIHRRVTSGA